MSLKQFKKPTKTLSKNSGRGLKVAVAARGEIAVRVLTACQELGLKAVLLYSEADEGSLAWRISEERVCIGPADPRQSYLNVSALVQGALKSKASHLHPGYGFLSESFELARACEKAGVIFTGPSPEHLKLFGDKTRAKAHALKCGLKVVPSKTLPSTDTPKQSLKKAGGLGFPVIVKSAYGGGGRGQRVVVEESRWEGALAAARRESLSACGSEDVFVERYLPSPRHIEVQVFGENSGTLHYLYERDCSLQRRRQKIVEEAPAVLSPALRRQIQQGVLELMKTVSYRQAGTVEFLLQDGEVYFMEVNPRLQVEHTVTEMVLGVDLVKAQLLSAVGGEPFAGCGDLKPRGHSMECRLYAEDMTTGLPTGGGTLTECVLPQGHGLRFDMGVSRGDSISSFYDPLIGKLIVHDQNRTRALAKMKQALKNTLLFGIRTNVSFLQDLLEQEACQEGNLSTSFVEERFLKTWREKDPFTQVPQQVIQQIVKALSPLKQTPSPSSQGVFNPWRFFK